MSGEGLLQSKPAQDERATSGERVSSNPVLSESHASAKRPPGILRSSTK